MMPSGKVEQDTVNYGQLRVIPLGVGQSVMATLRPLGQFDLGAGKGRPVEAELHGGLVGIVFDCRGRPIELPSNDVQRVAKLTEWIRAMDVYPDEFVRRYQAERPVGGKPETKGGRK
jgi:hypothetical protein